MAAGDVALVREMYELEQEIFHVWDVRDGMGYRCRVYSSEDEARAAALEPV